ncbi:hypothetical protein D3C86_2067810 [compost metagenome]
MHTVREARIDFEDAVADEFILKQARIFVRHHLIVIALQNQRWHGDGFQILGLVGFGERFDALIVRFRAADHSLTPPVLDGAL